MSKQLKSLFEDFLLMSPEAQVEKIKQIRHTRTVERPKSAVKRQKKQAKKDDKAKSDIKSLLRGMSEEEKAIFFQKLQEQSE